jgi:hypothetical protein
MNLRLFKTIVHRVGVGDGKNGKIVFEEYYKGL